MKQVLCAVAALCLAVATASAQSSGARVRIVHASPDAPAVDVYINDGKVLENLPFREYSEYLSLPAGTYNVEIRVTGTNTVVKQLSLPVQAGRDYTAIAVGYAGAGRTPGFDVMLLEDDNSAPADGRIKLRVAHTAPGAPAVDVYVTTPFRDPRRQAARAHQRPVQGGIRLSFGSHRNVSGSRGRRRHEDHRH